MASIPLRYKLAGCGFWTTFGALLARNAITIAMVQLSAAPSLSTSNKTGENDVEFCRGENVTDGVELRDHQFSYEAEIVWSHRQRALMLSAFFLGHAFGFLVVGPMLGKFGVRHSITFVLLSSSLLSLLFPTLAKLSYHVAFVSRLLLGLIQAIHLPAFMMFWGSWAPVQEKTRLVVSDTMGVPFGAATILYIGGYLMTYLDWRYVFWFAGIGCGLVGVMWHFVARNTPEEHPWLHDDEKQYILANRLVNVKPKNVPYRQILTSRPFWGIALSDMAWYWYINTSFIQMPTYLTSMQGFSVPEMGTLLGVAQITIPFVTAASSVLADYFMNRGFRNKTVRQFIQTTVLLPGLVEQLWYVNHCNTGLTYFIVWSSALATSHAAGARTNTMDICPMYAAHVGAIINSLALFMAFLSPNYASALQGALGDTPLTWAIIFSTSGVLLIVGCLCFIISADDCVQDWARETTTTKYKAVRLK